MTEDIKIYIATHKSFTPPKNDIYIPLQVGAEGKKDLGYLKDNTGDNRHITGSNSKLTVIIPFQNERCEVEKTVTSVRATAKDVKIMLVDDCSDDNYDYKKVAEIFGCDYYRNSKNLGVAGSRNFGVFKCTTPTRG